MSDEVWGWTMDLSLWRLGLHILTKDIYYIASLDNWIITFMYPSMPTRDNPQAFAATLLLPG